MKEGKLRAHFVSVFRLRRELSQIRRQETNYESKKLFVCKSQSRLNSIINKNDSEDLKVI
jgi:hypothetical protein